MTSAIGRNTQSGGAVGQRYLPAADWIARHAVDSPDTLAQVDLASGRKYTYRQMNERVGRLAAFLTSMGVKRGDRVAYMVMNSTDILEVIFGTWRIGGIALALNFRLTAPELSFIIGDAEPEIVIYDKVFTDVVNQLRDQTRVKHWIETDCAGGDTAYEQGLARAEPLLAKEIDQPLSELCMLMYSSGTTGKPKGVTFDHRMMLFSANNLVIAGRVTSASVYLAIMPLFHVGSLNVLCFPVLYVGGTNIIQRTFEPGETLSVINDVSYAVTHFLGVPAIFNALKNHSDVGTTDFSRLQTVLVGAESVPDPLVLWWAERGVLMQEGYAMTETAASSCLLPKRDVPAKVGSAGKAMMHSEMKIMREDGTEAAPNELGEIWTRGPMVTPGYWRRDDANAKAFVDGWFRTGDIARRDEEGYFYIEDRLSDMYISGGENVYPAEVENVLYGLDAIKEVAVVGLPDERWGESGCAVVVLREGASLDMADIKRACQGTLARYKHPAHLAFVDRLPRGATGKVLKFELRNTIPAQIKSVS